jgi:hypothetical protein
MGTACRMNGEESIYVSGGNARRKETTREIKT